MVNIHNHSAFLTFQIESSIICEGSKISSLFFIVLKLTKIDCFYFNTIENIDEIFDPSQIIELSIYEVENEELLCMLTNLRSLSISYSKVDFKSFLPKMRFLNYLTVRYYEECIDYIYTQCISLRKLTLSPFNGDDEFNFEKMIELV